MKCFCYFKDRNRSRGQKSATILSNQGKSEASECERAIRSSGSSISPRSIPELHEENSQNLRVFTFSELRQATCNFTRLINIGEGGFGCVYKGTIKHVEGTGDPLLVPVKKLNGDGYWGWFFYMLLFAVLLKSKGHEQWVAEVWILGVVEHPNLVKFIGHCAVEDQRSGQKLLVYEYMTNKSLEDHLFNMAYPALCWDFRLQIVLGAAQGLAYLHKGLEIQ